MDLKIKDQLVRLPTSAQHSTLIEKFKCEKLPQKPPSIEVDEMLLKHFCFQQHGYGDWVSLDIWVGRVCYECFWTGTWFFFGNWGSLWFFFVTMMLGKDSILEIHFWRHFCLHFYSFSNNLFECICLYL